MSVRQFIILAPVFLLLQLHAALAQDTAQSSVYEVSELNAGLPAAQDDVNLDTPQAMMETFLFSARQEDWERAAHALDLSFLPTQEQASAGPLLAQMLYDVLQRSMYLDWYALPDRPDAMNTTSSSENPMAGEPRRNIRLAIVDLPNRPVSIRIARLKPSNGDAAWVFANQTVQNIEEMHEVFGPTEFEKALPGFLRQTAFFTLAWWEVIALPLVLLGAIAAAMLTYRATGWLRNRSPIEMTKGVLDAVRMPVAIAILLTVFALVRELLFTFSGAVNAILTPVQTILFVTVIAMIAIRIVDAVLDRVARRNLELLSDDEKGSERELYTNISAARRLAIVLAFLIGAALVLVQLDISRSLGFSVLLSAGALGIVLAFAAREVLSNIMSSLQIALSKSARIGDAVLYDDNWCYVEKINFTYLQLRSWDNRRLMVPVNEFVSHTFENWTKLDTHLTQKVEIRLDHGADIAPLRETLEEFVEKDDDVIDKEDACAEIIAHDERAMTVRFLVSASNPSTAWNMHCRLRETLLTRIAELDREHERDENAPAYWPRERELVMRTSSTDEQQGKSQTRTRQKAK